MSEALLQSISNTMVLVLVAGYGWWLAHHGTISDAGRATIAKLVNALIPVFLFYSVTSKFGREQMIELLEMAFLPFITIGLNWAISEAMIRVGLVRKELGGVFVASFSGATVLFVGVPMTTALFGEAGIPYLLVYFFANCFFIWSVGLYRIQMDGVARRGGVRPTFCTLKSVKIIFAPPVVAFLLGIVFVLISIPIPSFLMGTFKSLGSITSPLALIFIGMTIHRVGFEKLRHVPREVWYVMFSCFVLRPLVMYLVSAPFDLDPMMRKVFVAATMLPVSSVIAVLARAHGADEEFASEAVGATTIGLVFALPVLLFIVNFV
jgi:auxin efflux carrier (AEC) family, putative malate permease